MSTGCISISSGSRIQCHKPREHPVEFKLNQKKTLDHFFFFFFGALPPRTSVWTNNNCTWRSSTTFVLSRNKKANFVSEEMPSGSFFSPLFSDRLIVVTLVQPPMLSGMLVRTFFTMNTSSSSDILPISSGNDDILLFESDKIRNLL